MVTIQLSKDEKLILPESLGHSLGLREADRILVINDGEIIERGTHEELLARKGFYHNLYVSQFKGHHDVVPELVGA